MYHNFSDSDKFAKNNELFFITAYHKFFPGLKSWEYHRDREKQFKGQDVTLTFKNGRQMSLDEKCRKEWYGDFLLEFEDGRKDNNGNLIPGWIEKKLNIECIAYGIIPIQTVYLFPWKLLQAEWFKNKSIWISKFSPCSIIPADNGNYITKSVAIPPDILFLFIPEIKISF